MTTIDSMSDAAPGVREAQMRQLPIPPYRGKSLPRIDYDAHPAYGGHVRPATLRERIHALNVFLRTFAFVTIRRIVDYDNMPLLTKEAGFSGLSLGTAAALHLDVCAHPRQPRIGMLTGARRPAMPANPALAEQDQIRRHRLPDAAPDEIEQGPKRDQPGFAKLDERRADIPPEKRKFDDNVYWCTRSADPDAFATVESIFKRYGIMELRAPISAARLA